MNSTLTSIFIGFVCSYRVVDLNSKSKYIIGITSFLVNVSIVTNMDLTCLDSSQNLSHSSFLSVFCHWLKITS